MPNTIRAYVTEQDQAMILFALMEPVTVLTAVSRKAVSGAVVLLDVQVVGAGPC